MERLAELRLNVSPRRNNGASAYLEDDEDIALPNPYTSPPSSPRHAFAMEVSEESPMGEVRAAVPFVWELIPGIPKDDFERQPADVGVFSDVTEETGSQDHGSSRSSEDSETLSGDSSNTEFDFCSRFEGIVEPLPLRPPSMSTAEELFSNGQVLPLRLPPRLQAVKHLRNSDSSCSDVSGSSSFKSYHSPQSPRSPQVLNAGSKLMLCGFIRTPVSGREEVTILGMHERKQKVRSLPPLRFLNTERSVGSNLSSETYFSSESVSSVSSFSSSSSSRGETNADSPQALWDSPNGKRNKGSTFNDLVTDKAIASRRIEDSKVSSIKEITLDRAKPRIVESRRELLKKHQGNGSPIAEKIDEMHGTLALTPQLSPSHAKSRPASSPLIDMHFKSSRKVHMGRALFANRFGMLCSCLGIPPESP